MKVFVFLFLAFCVISAVPTPEQDEDSKDGPEQNIAKINLNYLEKLIGKQLQMKPEDVHDFIKLLTELVKQSSTEIDDSEQLKHFENFLGPRKEAHMVTKLIIGVMKEYANRPQNLKITDETEKFLHYGEVLLEAYSAIARHVNQEADVLHGVIRVLANPDAPSYAEKFQFFKEKYDL